MNEQIVPVEALRKAEESEALVKTYENFQITTAEIYSGAGEHLKKIKAKTKELDDLRKSLTKPLDESKKRIMEFFQKPLEFLSKVETAIKSAMITWQNEQEKIRQAEMARLQAIQQKEADRLAKLATAAEKRGDENKAEEFKGRAAVVQSITPIVESKVEQIKGMAKTLIWKFRIIDVNKIPREYMIPNEISLGQVARATKGAVKIEGIEFYSEEVIRAGR